MTLTSSDRKKLRQQAQTMPDDIQLGKAGLSAGFISQAQHLFSKKELLKLRFSKDVQGDARQALAEEIAKTLDAQPVAILGHTLLLYKPNPTLDTPALDSR